MMKIHVEKEREPYSPGGISLQTLLDSEVLMLLFFLREEGILLPFETEQEEGRDDEEKKRGL